MKYLHFRLVFLGLVLFVGACGQKREIKLKDNLNQEIIGSWATDSNNCQIVLSNESTNLILVSFKDNASYLESNLPLAAKKDGVFIRLWARDDKNLFSASYTEGTMTLDNGKCNQAFHKVN